MSEKSIIEEITTQIQKEKGRGEALSAPLNDHDLINPGHLDDLPPDIQDQILSWYVDEKPSRQMVILLRKLGYDISHLRLWRWCKSKFRCVSDDGVPSVNMEEIRLELERKVIYGMLDIATETVRKMTAPEVKSAKEFDAMASAISKLVTAMASRERVEYEKGEAIKKVKETLKAEFQRIMAGKPELVEQVQELLEEAAKRITA